MTDGSDAAVRQLLVDNPRLEFFYIIWSTYGSAGGGYDDFHALATDPRTCRAAVERLCAEQHAANAEQIAELRQLPDDEQPDDPALPSGCSVSLCLVLPDRRRYVLMHSQRWNNHAQSHHSTLIPDVFDVDYYSDKARHGEYSRSMVRP